MNTRSITAGERLLINRRRFNQSQKDAAKEFKVKLYRYRAWESDERDPPSVSIGRLEPYEACVIKRKRAGMLVRELAEKLGCCAWWLCQMEYGEAPVDALVAFWGIGAKPWRGEARGRKVAKATG